ncbi:MAG: replication initiation protein [Bacteroidales bacterium]|nr:replication initiation protein [Candidatus Cryptobacteroides choladohippi]MCQ2180205.1 replication initiation protein [Bacteroidales bacterium]
MSRKQDDDNAQMQIATTTRNVVESYIFATGHQDLSIYSERLLMQLVKAAQCQVNGLNFRDGSSIAQVGIGPLGDTVVEIEAKELLNGENNTNYTQAKKAVLELMKKPISHERPAMKNGRPVLNDAGEQVYEFEAHNLLNDVYINKKPGVVIVNVNKTTWEAILDFSKGFRRYDLQVAMKFSRTCSLRMFKLISNQKNPLTFTLKELREQWGLTDKYKTTKDFIKYTIDSAKEELDRVSPWTFEYTPIYSSSAEENKGRVGRKSITAIQFFPKHQQKFESTSNVASQVSPSLVLGKAITDRLVKNLGFSMAEIKANFVLLDIAKKNIDLDQFLIELTPKALRANNTQGYVVNALKIHLKEKCNIVVRKNEIVGSAGQVKQPSVVAKPAPKPAGASESTIANLLNSTTGQPIADIPRKKSVDTAKSIGDILGFNLDPDEQ